MATVSMKRKRGRPRRQEMPEKNVFYGNLGSMPSNEQIKKEAPEPAKELLDVRQEKYNAFGQFLAYSLIEMDEVKAMELVKKFTNDLVQSKHNIQTKGFYDSSDNSSEEKAF